MHIRSIDIQKSVEILLLAIKAIFLRKVTKNSFEDIQISFLKKSGMF